MTDILNTVQPLLKRPVCVCIFFFFLPASSFDHCGVQSQDNDAETALCLQMQYFELQWQCDKIVPMQLLRPKLQVSNLGIRQTSDTASCIMCNSMFPRGFPRILALVSELLIYHYF